MQRGMQEEADGQYNTCDPLGYPYKIERYIDLCTVQLWDLLNLTMNSGTNKTRQGAKLIT